MSTHGEIAEKAMNRTNSHKAPATYLSRCGYLWVELTAGCTGKQKPEVNLTPQDVQICQSTIRVL